MFQDVHVSKLKYKVYILAKNHRVSYPLSFNKSNTSFTIIHFDVWGPSLIKNHNGIQWFVMFVNDYTHITCLYILKNKSDVGCIFRVFYQMINTRFKSSIKIFHSDNGGEFVNTTLFIFFQEHGILHKTTCSQTPKQNGIAECQNRHILKNTLTFLLGTSALQLFCFGVVTYVVYLLNQNPSRVLDFKTSMETLTRYISLFL